MHTNMKKKLKFKLAITKQHFVENHFRPET